METDNIHDLYESLLSFTNNSDEKTSVKRNDDLKPLKQSEEQSKRDKVISQLLIEYVAEYKAKNKSSKCIRRTILIFSLSSVALFILAGLICLCFYMRSGSKDWKDLAATVSAFLTCAGLLIGVIEIITKYAFPTDSEKNITEIVKAIQNNDLTNRYYDLLASGSINDSDKREIQSESDEKRPHG